MGRAEGSPSSRLRNLATLNPRSDSTSCADDVSIVASRESRRLPTTAAGTGFDACDHRGFSLIWLFRKQGDFPKKTGRRLSTNRESLREIRDLDNFSKRQITREKQGGSETLLKQEVSRCSARPAGAAGAPPTDPRCRRRQQPGRQIRSSDRFPVFSLLFAFGEII